MSKNEAINYYEYLMKHNDKLNILLGHGNSSDEIKKELKKFMKIILNMTYLYIHQQLKRG